MMVRCPEDASRLKLQIFKSSLENIQGEKKKTVQKNIEETLAQNGSLGAPMGAGKENSVKL